MDIYKFVFFYVKDASHCSGQMLYQKEWDVAIPSDPYISYKATVIQNSAFTALDDKLSAFAIQGFDTVLNVLKVSLKEEHQN